MTPREDELLLALAIALKFAGLIEPTLDIEDMKLRAHVLIKEMEKRGLTLTLK